MTQGIDDSLPGLGSRKGIPRVASHLDWGQLALDDVSGFVLSRIDGRTSLGEICLLSPFPREQTVEILRSLHGRGVIDIPGVVRPTKIELPTPPQNAPQPPPLPQPAPPQKAQPIPPHKAQPVQAQPKGRNAIDRVKVDRIPGERPVNTGEPLFQESFRRSVTGDLPRGAAQLDAMSQSTSPSPRSSFEQEAYRFPRMAPGQPVVPVQPAAAARPTVETPVLAESILADPSRVEPAAYRFPSAPTQFPIAHTIPSAADNEPSDLAEEVQRRVDEMLALVGQVDPSALLGLPAGADKKDVRRAYFKLSKEFHPDRHFNRQLGPYKRRLQALFNALTEAFDHLMHEPR